ncbi:MAG: hypothetical protein EOP45_07770 [Sphingobacteriaceae bacterium]|nr:MAG: hypothetical protein EOP45_07770 [Sphingobacteriaceae bacterium]
MYWTLQSSPLFSAASANAVGASLAATLEVEDALTWVEKVVAEADTEVAREDVLECAILAILTLEMDEAMVLDELTTGKEAGTLDATAEDEVLTVAAVTST